MDFSLKFLFLVLVVCISTSYSATTPGTIESTTTAIPVGSIDDAADNSTISKKVPVNSNDTCSQFNEDTCCTNETAKANNCSYCLRIVDGEGVDFCGSSACATEARNHCELEEDKTQESAVTTEAAPQDDDTTTAAAPVTTSAQPDVTTNATTDGNTTTTASAVTTEAPATTTNSSSDVTTIEPNTTTAAATTTEVPAPVTTTQVPSSDNTTTSGNSTDTTTAENNGGGDSDGQKFDGASFIGGIILCGGLVALIFFGLKFYKGRKEQNYHTL